MASLKKNVRVRPTQGNGGAFNQLDATVATSQTIKMGDVLSFSSNKVQQALALPGTNSTATTSTGNLPMLGVAMADITTDSSGTESTTGRTTIPVAVFDGNLEVLFMVWNPTPASSTQTDINFATAYNLARVRGGSASEWWYAVSSAAPTNGEFKAVERSPETISSEQYGLVYFRPIVSETVRQA